MDALPELFGYDLSHYVVAAERILAYKRIPHRRVPVSYYDKRELLRRTGQDYVPALVWDGRVVPWKEIPEFLEARQPDPTIFPPGLGPAARVIENWGHHVVEERVWRFVVPEAVRTFSDEVERWVFEELQRRARGPLELLAARREEFRAEMHEPLRLVEGLLDGREYLLGPASLADFGVFGSLSPLRYVGEEIPREFPRLGAWYDRIARIPSTAREPPAPRGPA